MNLAVPMLDLLHQSRTILRTTCPVSRDELLTTAWRLRLLSMFSDGNGRRVRHERFAGLDVEFFDYGALALLFDEVFVKQQYAFLARRPDPLIVDAGSNIGIAILYFKRLYPQARILSFEPDPATFAVLQKNVRANGLSGVEMRQAALGESEGQVEFFTDAGRGGAPYASTRPQIVEMCAGRNQLVKATVPTVRLSSQLPAHVDFLKLDIEGGEYAVLDDLASSGHLSQIHEIVMECHHHIRPEEDRVARVLTLLETAGFGYHIAGDPQRPSGYGCYQNLLIHAYRRDAHFAEEART